MGAVNPGAMPDDDPTSPPADKGPVGARKPARPTGQGPGRVLVALYGVLALSAVGRSVTQLVRDPDEAPLAFGLSAFAGLVYLVATVALARGGPRARVVAWVALGFEMVGVLVVGVLSLWHGDLFPRASVWSAFGQGYGYVPLVLPALGLWWLWHTRARTAEHRSAAPRPVG